MKEMGCVYRRSNLLIVSQEENMKTAIVAGLIATALVTGAAGCMSGMHGRMMAGMTRSQASTGEGSTSDNMMSMGQKGMMDCCTDQCPMMKGKSAKPQPS